MPPRGWKVSIAPYRSADQPRSRPRGRGARRGPGSGPIDLRLGLEERRRAGRRSRSAVARPQRQRPDAAQHEAARERARRLAERVGLLADRVEQRLRSGDHAGDGVAVPREVLRRGVEDEVGAVLERAEQRRAQERVVGDDHEAVAVAERRRSRRGRRSAAAGSSSVSRNSSFVAGRDRRLDGGEVGHVDGRDRDPAPREVLLPSAPGRDREQLVAHHDVVARSRWANSVAETAAMPDAETTQSSAPSSDATFSSRARLVGLPVRE